MGRPALLDSIVGAALPAGLDVLFEHLPGACFFVKDAERRFRRVNRAFVELTGLPREADVLGKRDEDIFPPSLADNYARDDRRVLASGLAIVEKAEVIQRADGAADWFCTTKIALRYGEHSVGLCGVTRRMMPMRVVTPKPKAWDSVMDRMLRGYANRLDTAALAKLTGLSTSQFTRQFRRRFQMSPRDYLLNVRLEAACRLLMETDTTVTQIAERTGFYDPSHFTNHFAKRYGQVPSKYRCHFRVMACARLQGNDDPSKAPE